LIVATLVYTDFWTSVSWREVYWHYQYSTAAGSNSHISCYFIFYWLYCLACLAYLLHDL